MMMSRSASAWRWAFRASTTRIFFPPRALALPVAASEMRSLRASRGGIGANMGSLPGLLMSLATRRERKLG